MTTEVFIDHLWGITSPDALDIGEGSGSPLALVQGEGALRYMDRMRALYRAERAVFEAILPGRQGSRAVLVLCSDDHAALLLSGILSKLGATCRGEVPTHKTPKCGCRWCFNEGTREGCNFCLACWKSLPASLRRELAVARASCPNAPFDGATTTLYNETVSEALMVLESKLP
jgi:hypothetical protein